MKPLLTRRPLTLTQSLLLSEMPYLEWVRPMDIGGPVIGSTQKSGVLTALVRRGLVERRSRVGSYLYRRIIAKPSEKVAE